MHFGGIKYGKKVIINTKVRGIWLVEFD